MISLEIKMKIGIIGAPVSYGQPILGVETGPEVIRKTNVFSNSFIFDYGNVFSNKKLIYKENKLINNCEEIGDYLKELYFSLLSIKSDLLITIGGDHSIGTATVLSAIKKNKDIFIIWVDAHADINTPITSFTKNYHGMPLATCLKLYDRELYEGFEWTSKTEILNPNKLIYIGLRDIDKPEELFLKRLGIKYYTAKDVRTYGIEIIMKNILKIIDKEKIHLSFDIDACDPIFAPSTGTSVKEGLSEYDSVYIVNSLKKQIVSFDLVEVNTNIKSEESHKTINLSVSILTTLLSKSVL